MRKNVKATFAVCLMLASCFCIAFVPTTDAGESPGFIGPDPVIAPRVDDPAIFKNLGLEVGDVYGLQETADTARVFSEISEAIRNTAPTMMDKLYEMLIDEGLADDKESAKNTIRQMVKSFYEIEAIHEETYLFIDGLIAHPSAVELDYDTFVVVFKDLVTFGGSFILGLMDLSGSISLDEFNFSIDVRGLTYIARPSTYSMDMGFGAEVIVNFDFKATFAEKEYYIKDGKFTLSAGGYSLLKSAPNDLYSYFDQAFQISVTGVSNFLNSSAKEIEGIISEGSEKPFDFNIMAYSLFEFDLYPAGDFPFGGYSDNTSMIIDYSVVVVHVSTTPAIEGLIDSGIVSESGSVTIPVTASDLGDYTSIIGIDDEIYLDMYDDGGFDLLISSDSYAFIFNVGEGSADIQLYRFTDEQQESIVIEIRGSAITLLVNGDTLVDAEQFDIKSVMKRLDDQEKKAYSDTLSDIGKHLLYTYEPIPSGEILTIEFLIPYHDDSMIVYQSEMVVAGAYPCYPGLQIYMLEFSSPPVTILDWVDESGNSFDPKEPVTSDITYVAVMKQLIESKDSLADAEPGKEYSMIIDRADSVIDCDQLVPGANITFLNPDLKYKWVIEVSEGDVLTDTILDLRIEQYDVSEDIDKQLGGRVSTTLGFAASGTMPSTSVVIIDNPFGPYYFGPVDVYVVGDDGKLQLLETVTAGGPNLAINVPHCSEYVVAEHMDEGMDLTMIALIIVVVLVVIAVLFFVFKNKNKSA